MKVILVDDEELSLKRLGDMLKELPDIEICGLFYTAADALKFIEGAKVDAVFLDICIPEVDGLTLASKIQEIDSSINVVFVTGYDEYAVTAFELEAVDYLLKPIRNDRLEKTIQRLLRACAERQTAQYLRVSCLGGFQAAPSNPNFGTISWRSPKTEELFAFLIFKRKVSRDEIINTLWDDLDPDKALKNINTTVYYIRKALSPFGLEKCITTTHKEIRINTELISCDLYELEKLLSKTSRSSFLDATDLLIELYGGELFQGKAYEWSFVKSRNLESSLTKALLAAAEYHRSNLDYEAAERIYQVILSIDPLNEDACGSMIKLYLLTDRKMEAHRLYLCFENLLMNELGEKPQEKLRKLME
ncbi:MAG: response regulator receiver and domain protein [Bacillota bacterium]|jgi:two-component SAPR family response regulator|nr:response regulator receiver and domain protein [Bacillota bacterium]